MISPRIEYQRERRKKIAEQNGPVRCGAPTAGRFDEAYPPREGFGYSEYHMPRDTYHHVGYTTKNAKPCPICGHEPVFEQFTDDLSNDSSKPRRNTPAQVFVAICPRCEARARGTGTLEQMLQRWNERKFSRDSVIVCRKLTDIDRSGLYDLVNKIWDSRIPYAADLVRRKHELTMALQSAFMNDVLAETYYAELRVVRGLLTSLYNDIMKCPFGEVRDPESVLSDIRKNVYHYLTTEERLEIPLKLVSM